MDFLPNDIIVMKKPHPCGSCEFVIRKTGADFRLECLGCGHQITLSRKQVERSVKPAAGAKGYKM